MFHEFFLFGVSEGVIVLTLANIAPPIYQYKKTSKSVKFGSVKNATLGASVLGEVHFKDFFGILIGDAVV